MNLKMCFVGALLLVLSVVSAQEKYTTKYDGVNLEEILKSDRLFNNYYKCLMDTGRCTPDGNELKRTLPDALKTDCSKCSEKQKDGTDRVIRFLIEKKPKQWDDLQKRFDPENVYISKYKPELDAKNIKV